jgi:hypothetical protein
MRMGYLTTNWKTDLHRLALGGAWFFAIFSLVPLLWLGLGAGDGGTGRVFGTEVGGQAHSIWGLTYSGWPGAALLWMEVLAISSAAFVTALPHGWASDRLRRAGHAMLIGWASLWTIGVSHLASLDPGFFAVQATFLAALLGCTIYRAWLNWRPGGHEASNDAPALIRHDPFEFNEQACESGCAPPTDIAAEEKLMLHLRDVKSSSAVHEVTGAAPSNGTLKDKLRRVVNRQSMRETADGAGRFVGEAARSSGGVARAIGRRFVAAARAWKSYDAEDAPASAQSRA